MINFSFLTGRIDKKRLFMVVLALLLILNIGRLSLGYYQNQKEEVENRIDLLNQYRKAVVMQPQLKKRVAQLEKRSEQIDRYLFSGSSVEEISSAMQILLQNKVADAGLEPESIRPMRKGANVKPGEIADLVIKMRLVGTLDEFVDFLANLYRSSELIKIETFSLKPYKGGLKISLDVKGFYHLAQPDS
ncbi:MAG: type II secretion system protein GspM [Thermodesulfobacteriota bacterium]|nr:type II secretion system protein GspM [Thermodesulfobacteriota bacterium]